MIRALIANRFYIEIAPSEYERARGWDSIAQVFIKKRDLASAAKAVSQALKNNKDSVWWAFVVAMEQNDRAQIEKLEKLVFVKTAKNDRGARIKQRFELYSRGYVALKNERTDEAIAYFQETVRHKPPIWNIEAFEDCLADAYMKVGRLDESTAEYRRIIQLNPNYPLVYFHLAQVLQREGKNDEARDAFTNFLQVWKNADDDIPEVIYAKRIVGES